MPDYSLNWTAKSSAIQGVKGVNNAVRPTEGGLAEAGGLLASILPLVSIPHPARMPDGPANAGWI